MRRALLISVFIIALAKCSTPLEDVQAEIELLRSREDFLETKKDIEDFLLEKKFFHQGQNTILKMLANKNLLHVSFLTGIVSKQLNLDRFLNQYILIGATTKLMIYDLSGALIIEQELPIAARQILITSPPKAGKALPKIYILSETADVLMYSLNFKKTTTSNNIEYSMSLKFEFNIWEKNSVLDHLDIAPTFSKTLKNKIDKMYIREVKQSLYFIVVDIQGNI